jgi:ubiquitin carboxyl-terminal hydrolase 7
MQSIREAVPNRMQKPGVMATLNLFLETPATPDGELPPIRSKSDLLIFFKQYCPDPQQPSIKYAGHRLVPKDAKTKELHPLVRSLGGLADNDTVDLFEEIKFEPTVMVDRLGPSITLSGAQLEDGDIIVFQRQLSQRRARCSAPPPRSTLSLCATASWSLSGRWRGRARRAWWSWSC